LLLLALTGCATIGMDVGAQDALNYGFEAQAKYVVLHDQYRDIYRELGADGQAWMDANVAPVMDQLKDAIILYNDAAIAWDRAGKKPLDIMALRASVNRLVVDAADKLMEVRR
jgi:hypothetical protein